MKIITKSKKIKKKEKKEKWTETLLEYRIKHHGGKDVVLKKKYKAKCPFCGLNFEAKPSIFMLRYLINYAEIECANCNERIGLNIEEKGKKMESFKLNSRNINKTKKMPSACFEK
jgi:transcription elongation factor Elf1